MKLKINLLLKLTLLVLLGTTISLEAQSSKQIKKERKLYSKNYKKVIKVYSKIEETKEKKAENGGADLDQKTPEEFVAADYIKTMDVQTGKQHPQKVINVDKEIRQGKYDPTSGNAMKMFPSSNSNLTGKIDVTNQWTERGPYKVGGRTRAIMFDPNDATSKKVWAGGISGGLWYNNDITDANSEWKQVSDIWANMTVSCITYDPINSQIFYVGTGESYTNGAIGSGIWKTSNGGSTWTQIFLKTKTYSGGDTVDGNFFVNDIKVRNNNGASEVYVGLGNTTGAPELQQFIGVNEVGLYKSIDAGANFTQIDLVPGQKVSANSIYISSSSAVYVGTTGNGYGNPTGGKIFKSTDGASFNEVYTVGNISARVQVVGSKTNSNLIYALMQGTGTATTSATNNDIVRFVRSSDAGVSWQSSFGGVPALTVPKNYEKDAKAPFDFTRGQSFYDLVVAVDPSNDNTVYVGGIDFHKTTDGGATWTPITKWTNSTANFDSLPNFNDLPVVHSDHHAIIFNPSISTSTQMIFGGDGGVFYVPNRAAAPSLSYASVRNNRYNVTQYYNGQLNPSSTAANEEILGGTQDNGTQQFMGAPVAQGTLTTSYADTEYTGGDGGFVGFDDKNAYKTSAYTNNNLYLTNNNGLIKADVFVAPDNATGHFINEYAIDRNLDILYSYKADNPNIKLFRIKNLKTAAPSGAANVVDQASIVKDELDLGAANNSETLSAIVVSPFTLASTTLFVGTTKNKLLKVTNANTTPVITNITNPFVGNISDIEFGATESQILVTISNFNTISVYYTIDGGATWQNKEGNLIDVPVRCAFINPDNPKEVLLGTESGIFGTTNFDTASPTWAVYNKGIGNVRITNLDYRPSDKTLLATTFGRGIFTTTNNTTALATSESVVNNQNSIYPNPSTGGIFTVKAVENKDLSVTIFDVSGKLVYKESNVGNAKTVNSNLPLGIYIVKVNNGTKDILTTKLIVK